jgi:FtsP/CotA-like multicopper oxidase with cupredoxin domain
LIPTAAQSITTGGKRIFSVSGQVFPTATIQGRGEVWRLISCSGSRGYSLALRDDDTGEMLPFQILSLDGVAIDSTSTNTRNFASKAGNRFVQAAAVPIVHDSPIPCASRF